MRTASREPGDEPDLPAILRRVPPNCLEAEQSALAVVLLDNAVMERLCDQLETEDFYYEVHRMLWVCMRELHRRREPIDAVTLFAILQSKKWLGEQVPKDFVFDLLHACPRVVYVDRYVRLVKDASRLRAVASAATQVAYAAYGYPLDLAGFLERSKSELLPLLNGAPTCNGAVEQRPRLLDFAASKALANEVASRPHIVQDLLTVEDISGIAAKKGVGKSSVLRTLAVAVARGDRFLDLECNQTRVWYLDLESGSHELRHAAFERLGWDENNHNLVLTAGTPVAGKPWAFEWLADEIRKGEFGLVIIDTYLKFCRIEAGNDYSSALYGTAPLEEVCKATKAHIMVAHHAQKIPMLRAGAADMFLGSVGIAGAFGVCLALRKHEGCLGIFMDPPRYTKQVIEGEWRIEQNADGREVLTGKLDWKVLAAALKPRVLDEINQTGEEYTTAKLATALGERRSLVTAAANMLFEDGAIERTGTGRGRAGYRYSKRSAVAAPQATEPTQESFLDKSF